MTTAPDGPVASRVRLPLTDVTIGGVESQTNTWNDPVDVFPYASVAVSVTVVKLSGKRLPDGIE